MRDISQTLWGVHTQELLRLVTSETLLGYVVAWRFHIHGEGLFGTEVLHGTSEVCQGIGVKIEVWVHAILI